MVYDANFSSSSPISWLSVLLVEFPENTTDVPFITLRCIEYTSPYDRLLFVKMKSYKILAFHLEIHIS
jgi:hypothetical protein